MSKILLTLVLLTASTGMYSQITFDLLINTFDGFSENSYKQNFEKNSFKLISQDARKGNATWALDYNTDNKKSKVSIEVKAIPVKSMWIVSSGHQEYFTLENEIRKYCEFGGSLGCSEVETWESYKHISGIEFRLIRSPDSEETGEYIIEVLK